MSISTALRVPVVALPLAPSTRQQLLTAGYATAADLQPHTPESLAAASGLPLVEAQEVLHVALGTPQPGWRLSGATSARQLLQAERIRGRITTCCAELDALLVGGVAVGAVTEFCGAPGVGKTQLGLQLAVDAQIPPAFGGLGGKAVYIDTEGSFMFDRLVDIASAAERHIHSAAAARGDPSLIAQAASFTLASILEGILYFRVQDHTQQLAVMRTLDALLASQPQIVLVVVDSVTFHFRQDWPDAGLRARLLAAMAQDAAALAEGRGVAVVFMNQVTTKVVEEAPDGSGGSGVLMPALGESWGQASSTRMVLYWEGPQRYAHLLKASMVPDGVARGGTGGAVGAGGGRGRRQQGPQYRHLVAPVAFDVTVEGVRSCSGGGTAQQQQQRPQQQQQRQQHPGGFG